VNPQNGISNIIAIKSLAEFQKSARNILIVTTEVALTL
jgi:type III secretory pathway component EscU